MAKRNDNATHLRAGQLVKGGRSPVGSIAEVRRNAAKGEGYVGFPTSRQQAGNRKSGVQISTNKQPVRGFWGKG